MITPGRGLVPHDETVGLDDLRAIAAVGVSLDEPRYRGPLERDASTLALTLGERDSVILLGSIATNKYVEVLERFLDRRLFFPSDFVGRGDMSRGGLMLRHVLERRELSYVPFAGAVRRGNRPPKLQPLRHAITTPASRA